MNYLQFAVIGPKYVRNIAFLLISYRFSEMLKKLRGCFSHTEYLQKA